MNSYYSITLVVQIKILYILFDKDLMLRKNWAFGGGIVELLGTLTQAGLIFF